MEHYQLELEQRQQRALELIDELDIINKTLSQVKVEKDAIEQEIQSLIGHAHVGHRTYEIGPRKITIKVDQSYSLNTKLYKSGDIYLPPEFDPIKAQTTFKVNQALFDRYENEAPEEVRGILNTLVTKNKERLSIVIGNK